jgi:hypothetical protein
MARSIPSALIIDHGKRVLLRIHGQCYELTQEALRAVLGLPDGPPGLGITINRDVLQFEFPLDHQTVQVTASQLRRRLAKEFSAKSGSAAFR